jgi:hypothetical protein
MKKNKKPRLHRNKYGDIYYFSDNHIVENDTIRKNLIEVAKKLGKEAFHAGKPSAPALNKTLNELVFEHLKGKEMGWSIPIWDAYLTSWTRENLAAPSSL